MKTKNIILGIAIVLVAGLLVFNAKKETSQDQLVSRGDILGATSFFELSDGDYSAQDGQTVVWTGTRNLLGSYNDQGTLDITKAEIILEKGDISGELVLDMESLSTTKTMTGYGFENLTKHLKTEFFDTKNYPESKFTITELSSNENGSDVLVGDLTIKETTRSIEVPVELSVVEGGTIELAGQVSFDRTLWGVTAASGKFFSDLGESVVDDLVSVEFNLSI